PRRSRQGRDLRTSRCSGPSGERVSPRERPLGFRSGSCETSSPPEVAGRETMPHVIVKYRPADGFFSNVVVPMMWIWSNSDPSRISIGLDWAALGEGAFEVLFRGNAKLVCGQCADSEVVYELATPRPPHADAMRLLEILPDLQEDPWGYVPWCR